MAQDPAITTTTTPPTVRPPATPLPTSPVKSVKRDPSVYRSDSFSTIPATPSTPATAPTNQVFNPPDFINEYIEKGRYHKGQSELVQSMIAESYCGNHLIDLGTKKLDDGRGLKAFVGTDRKLHIITFSSDAKEDSLLKEHVIDMDGLKKIGNISIKYGNLAYVDQEKFDSLNESNRADLSSNDTGEYDKLLTAIAETVSSGTTIGKEREGRGIEGLSNAGLGTTREKLLEKADDVPEFKDYKSHIERDRDIKENFVGESDWFTFRGGKGKLCLLKDSKGKSHYRFYNVSGNVVREFWIIPSKLQKILNEDQRKIYATAPDGLDLEKVEIDKLAQYIANHVSFDTDEYTAHINRRDGRRQIAEIAYEGSAAKGDNLEKAFENLKTDGFIKSEDWNNSPLLSFKKGEKPGVIESAKITDANKATLSTFIETLLKFDEKFGNPDNYEVLTNLKIDDEYKRVVVTSKGILVLSWKEKSTDRGIYDFKTLFITKNDQILRDAKKQGYDFTDITPTMIKENDPLAIKAEQRARTFFGYSQSVQPPLTEKSIEEETRSMSSIIIARENNKKK